MALIDSAPVASAPVAPPVAPVAAMPEPKGKKGKNKKGKKYEKGPGKRVMDTLASTSSFEAAPAAITTAAPPPMVNPITPARPAEWNPQALSVPKLPKPADLFSKQFVAEYLK